MRWQTESMQFELLENGIVIISPPADFKGPETLEHASENIATRDEHAGEKLKAILAHLPNHYVNAEATGFYKKNAPDVPIALVGSSALKTMVGNFMLKLVRPGRPMRLFDEEYDAMKWLEEQLEKANL